jgi:Anti-sigma-K factor rskA/Putative zinc-finger
VRGLDLFRARPTCEDVADLAAAVALDAADPRDERKLERHLTSCPACARSVDDLRATAALLGSAVPQVEPPVELRERVLTAAAAAARTDGRSDGVGWPRAWLVPLQRAPGAAAWGAVAASILISFGSLAWIANLQRQVASLESEVGAARDRAARYDRVVQMLGSYQIAVRQLTPTVQTMRTGGMVYLDPVSGSGMVAIHDLPQPPAGRAWQLWFVRGTDRISGGMLWPDNRGNCYAMVAVPPDVGSFDAIGITEEPSAGSAWPTSPRVITAKLAAE